ncbi:MAG TPA: terminase large subunit [Syntrophobacter fumaroxidans]|nr:terminase large subunit [Syntrophobacter fumaroxidans]
MARTDSSKAWVDFKPGGFDPFLKAEGYHLDVEAGQKAIDFVQECCRHVRGPKKGQLLRLELWQQTLVGHLYGWKDERGLRRFIELFLFVPRKNGKSLLGSSLALLELVAGDPNTPEIFIAAADREQGRQLFDTAKLQIGQEPELSKRLQIFKNDVKYPARNGFFKVISSEAGTKHGANLSAFFADETHAWPNSELFDVCVTSTGARLNPLVVSMTTAGYDRQSFAYQKYDYAKKVRDGIVEDPAFFPVIYEADPEADWKNPATWASCNPNLGESISREYLERESKRAQDVPAYEQVFKRLHLNIWTESETRWLPMDAWNECAGAVDLDQLKGRTAYAGLDLSTTTDLSCICYVFPPDDEGGKFIVFLRVWCPEEGIERRSRRDRAPYDLWVKQGYLVATPGAVVDYDFIRAQILKDADFFDLREIAFDPWNATQIATQLQEQDGLTVVSFRQGMKSMAPACKEVEAKVLGEELLHGGDPVLDWAMSNAVMKFDAAGNYMMDKGKSTERIDPAVALAMALDRACRHQNTESVYATRGLRTI